MADSRVQIIIEAINRAQAELRNVQGAFKDIGGQAGQLDGRLKSASTSADGLVKGLMGLYVVKQMFDSLAGSVRESLSYLGKLETSSLGIAASFLASGKYIDATTGKALEGQTALRAAQEDTKSVIQELQIANFETIATLDQLVRVYQETLPIAMAKGFNREQIKEFTVATVQAAGALGISLDMLAEETRSMLTGAINPRTSRVAVALGITPEDIRACQGDAKKLFDFLIERLMGFKIAGIASQTTWKGLWSNMMDMALMVGGKILTPLFDTIKNVLGDIQGKIMNVDEATGKVRGFKPEFLENLKEARTLVGKIAAALVEVIAAFDIAGTAIGEQAARMAWRLQNPLKTIKAVLGDGKEPFPQSDLPGKIAYYKRLMDLAYGDAQPDKSSSPGSKTTYDPNPPKKDTSAGDGEKKRKQAVDQLGEAIARLKVELGELSAAEYIENEAAKKLAETKDAAAVAEWKRLEMLKLEREEEERSAKTAEEAESNRQKYLSERFSLEQQLLEVEREIWEGSLRGNEDATEVIKKRFEWERKLLELERDRLVAQGYGLGVERDELSAVNAKIAGLNARMAGEISRELTRQKAEAEKTGKEIGDALTRGMEDFFYDPMQSSWQSLWDSLRRIAAKSMADMVADWIAAQAKMTSGSGGSGGFFSFLAGLFGGGAGPGGQNIPLGNTVDLFSFHTGGGPGEGRRRPTFVIPSYLPKAHTGLGPRERVTVTLDDETIFTAGQTRALGLMARGGREQPPVNITINALDAANVAQWAYNNKDALASAGIAAARGNHPSRRRK